MVMINWFIFSILKNLLIYYKKLEARRHFFYIYWLLQFICCLCSCRQPRQTHSFDQKFYGLVFYSDTEVLLQGCTQTRKPYKVASSCKNYISVPYTGTSSCKVTLVEAAGSGFSGSSTTQTYSLSLPRIAIQLIPVPQLWRNWPCIIWRYLFKYAFWNAASEGVSTEIL